MSGCRFVLWEPGGELVCAGGTLWALITGTPITACPHCVPSAKEYFAEYCEDRETSTFYDGAP